MADTTPPAAAPAPPPLDPEAMLRSRNFVVLLVFAAVVGVFVSLASWGFLELVHQIQLGVFSDLPDALGYDTMPTWWPIPVLVLAGIPVAFAIVKLPGKGGHVPANGLQMGSITPEHGARGRARRAGDPRPRAGARPRGAAHRDRWWARGVRREPGEEGRAAATAHGARGGRKLRRHLGDLRLAHRRRDPGDRGQRTRRRDLAADPHPGADRRRHRVARVHRHGELDRAQHQRVRARAVAAPALRPRHVGRDRLDDRAGRCRRAR